MKRLVTSEQVQELFKVQLENWQLARENYLALGRIKTKRFQYDDFEIHLQFNPARLVSSAAKTGNKSLKERKCFLCPANLPEEQRGLPFGDDYQVLVNPFPIFPEHFTIPLLKHLPQSLSTRFEDMLDMATALDKYVIFYNGPRCGASAPDHAHFQAGNKGFLPIEKEWKSIDKELLWERTGLKLYTLKNYLRSVLIIESEHKTDAAELFKSVYEMLEVKAGEEEPMFNVLTWREEDKWIVCLFLREKHRPACYSIEGDGNLLLSPGAVDMGGVLIIPLEKDFEKITKEDVSTVFREVRLNDMDKLSMRLKREL